MPKPTSLPRNLARPTFALATALFLMAGGLRAQGTHTAARVLPKGETSGVISVAIPLPPDADGAVEGVTFVKTDGTPLPATVALSEPRATSTFAGAERFLYVDVAFEREDAAEELGLRAEVDYGTRPAAALQRRNGPVEPTTSVLATGRTVKLSVDADGVYAIDAGFLSDLGLPTDGGPGAVRLYTQGGAMLPERVGDDYPTDLQEVALLSQDNGDARWDGGERLLFYGEGEDVWTWNADEGGWDQTSNLYSEVTHYYLKVGGSGLRMRTSPAEAASRYDDTYTFRARWEEDLVNVLNYASTVRGVSGQGSGQPWYGPVINRNREVARPGLWELGAVPAGATGRLKAEVWGATNVNSAYTVSVGGASYRSDAISSSSEWGDANVRAVALGKVDTELALPGGTLDVTVRYPGNPDLQVAFVDYVQLNHDATLGYDGDFTRFQRAAHADGLTYGFRLPAPAAETTVIDLTDGIRPSVVATEAAGAGLRFGYRQSADSPPREFAAFPTRGSFPRPAQVGEVANSNLHGIASADMVIVYGENLGPAADKLAEHRRAFSGLEVVTVPIAPVFEEFGGGRPDPTALRNFLAMVRQRDRGLRYLLLLGDGHYDPRNIVEDVPSVLPTFQTKRADHEVAAFPTDDYFGLLDEGEGIVDSSYPRGGLDLGIGRIPAVTLSDAVAVVDKTIRYDTDPEMRGAWRLRNVFVADDEDDNRHVNDIDEIARNVSDSFPQFNQTKIYVDAYEQESSSGGERYPQAAEDISRNMFRGNLVTTYLGHGGPRGWGQERFLDATDIPRWRAPSSLPLLLTATCTFTGYDDPSLRVIGENVLLQRDGGVAASFSTVRPVYTNSNKVLTQRSLNVLLDRTLTRELGIGELLNRAKNSGANENDRKYSLFGDPALKLAVPQLDVVATAIDSVEVGELTGAPAVAPLREVELSGVVRELDGRLAADFDGVLELTVFDQDRTSETLANDDDSRARSFGQIGATLFTGSATVAAGRWTARFMLPLDVSLSRGNGRVSLYATAEDGRDGAGVFSRFVVDGLAAPAVDDRTPPTVEPFIGDDTFVEGGVSGTDPVLYVKLSDDTGINVSGSAIGHDLTATLRGPNEASYVLNDFYEAATDDYRRGEARFPVYGLPEGEYELEVRAWDLANNTGVGRTSFLVTSTAEGTLRRVLNYPNPMVDATCFQFEHTAAGRLVDVRVDIYTTGGRLVRSIDYSGVADGPRFGGGDDCISWNGTDEFGQRLARGVYLYRVRMRSEGTDEVAESGFEKLVLLR